MRIPLSFGSILKQTSVQMKLHAGVVCLDPLTLGFAIGDHHSYLPYLPDIHSWAIFLSYHKKLNFFELEVNLAHGNYFVT